MSKASRSTKESSDMTTATDDAVFIDANEQDAVLSWERFQEMADVLARAAKLSKLAVSTHADWQSPLEQIFLELPVVLAESTDEAKLIAWKDQLLRMLVVAEEVTAQKIRDEKGRHFVPDRFSDLEQELDQMLRGEDLPGERYNEVLRVWRACHTAQRSYLTREVQSRLGLSTRQAVSARVKEQTIIRFAFKGTSFFPRWQFRLDGEVTEDIGDLVDVLNHEYDGRVPSLDSAIRHARSDLGGATIEDLLDTGDTERAVELLAP